MSVKKNNHLLGISWFVLHCLIFAIISIITKLLIRDGLHIFEIVFFQTTFGSLILLPWVVIYHIGNVVLLSYKAHIARAFAWAVATILFFYATNVIPMGRAIAISFAVPLFTTVLAVIFLKEKLHARRVVALICGFIGMLIIIRPGVEKFEIQSYYVVIAAFLWSTTDIMIKMASKTHHAFINTFYFAVFAAICTLPMAIFVWVVPNLEDIFWLVFLAALFVFNIISITKSYEYADLTIVMPFVFSELIFVAGLAYVVFDEMISVSTAIGSAIIIISASYITYRERIEKGRLVSEELLDEFSKELGEKVRN